MTIPSWSSSAKPSPSNVFAGLWTRPGLDLKTRTLICVISDAATGQEPELAIHLRMARRQGWSEEELTEALLHLLGYVGAPLTPRSHADRQQHIQGTARRGHGLTVRHWPSTKHDRLSLSSRRKPIAPLTAPQNRRRRCSWRR